MESHEVLREAVSEVGAKRVASDLRVSSSLVYKWCEEDASGARNPLDRVRELVQSTGSAAPIAWLCKQAGGTFVRDPEVELSGFDAEYVLHTQRMLREFSELLQVVSQAVLDDGRVDAQEAARIRVEWEQLKTFSETFVTACERGLFDAGE